MTPRLLAITPGDGRPDLARWLEALGAAGLPAVLLREPQRSTEELERLAAVARACIPQVWLHARHPAARRLAEQATGVHFPASGGSSHLPFGVSCHSEAEVHRALEAGAAYALLSPVFPPLSKPGDTRPTLGAARYLAAAAGRPVVALGGITAERGAALLTRGAPGIACMGALFGGPPERGAAVTQELTQQSVSSPSTSRSPSLSSPSSQMDSTASPNTNSPSKPS